ncbi:OTU domain-containing protein 4-like [Hydra vulgaris]|uniref:OTU domain-containing protein 4-like n=1 Tax=Hydra vulgaris TaxID=6087 RepID=UPI001F5EB7CD|nr:OTU domain-containing protein 4-like isoform X1 [Hydra vulgaris]
MKLSKKRSEDEILQKSCDKVSYIKSESLEIVEVVISKTNSFIPTNSKWRTKKCSLLKISLTNKTPFKKGFAVRKKKLQLGKPISVDKIEGDGNCLFRALSQEVCLSQEFYKILRQLAIDTLLKAEYRNAFDAYISKLVLKYISDSKMETDQIWGTDVEVYALATVLNTPIAVYYKPPEASVFLWFFYKPLLQNTNGFKLMEIKENDQIVYLQNTGVHYDRVLAVS